MGSAMSFLATVRVAEDSEKAPYMTSKSYTNDFLNPNLKALATSHSHERSSIGAGYIVVAREPAFDRNAWKLTASQALAKVRSGDLTIESYARSLLSRIEERDGAVGAWAYIDRELVIQQARMLDRVPMAERGSLHGLPVGIKDVIYTKDMPTKFNSPIYKDNFPKVDASSIVILRKAGALIFGKTTTTEFGAILRGTTNRTRNPHDPSRTAGGSSSGSGAAVGDFQCPVALGTQTGGSTIRPASFNGIYALKPTWNSICREGQKIYSVIFDTLGLFARSIDDISMLADAFGLKDDEDVSGRYRTFRDVRGAKFAFCKTIVWDQAGEGSRAALYKAVELLRANGATVEELNLPSDFDDLPEYHRVVLHSEGASTFLAEHCQSTTEAALDESLVGHVQNEFGFTHRQHLEAFDGMAALRPRIDKIAAQYDAILTPSVVDEAPKGLPSGSTGSAAFCDMWSALHNPVVNIPGFKGANGMPIGVSLAAPRYRDRHLLKVCKAVGEIFEADGGWKRMARG